MDYDTRRVPGIRTPTPSAASHLGSIQQPNLGCRFHKRQLTWLRCWARARLQQQRLAGQHEKIQYWCAYIDNYWQDGQGMLTRGSQSYIPLRRSCRHKANASCGEHESLPLVTCQQRKAILPELHHGHPGMVRMKALARSYVWWPGIDADIESWVKECNPCRQSSPNPSATYIHPWWKANKPMGKRSCWLRNDRRTIRVNHGRCTLLVHWGYSYKFQDSSDYRQSHESNICNARSAKSSCQW